MYVVDSSVLFDIVNGTFTPSAAIRDFELTISSITAHELLVGAKSAKDHFVAKHLLSNIRVLPFELDDAFHSSSIHKELQKKGKLINGADIMIAGTCRKHNATVVTRDKDFKKITHLKKIVL